MSCLGRFTSRTGRPGRSATSSRVTLVSSICPMIAAGFARDAATCCSVSARIAATRSPASASIPATASTATKYSTASSSRCSCRRRNSAARCAGCSRAALRAAVCFADFRFSAVSVPPDHTSGRPVATQRLLHRPRAAGSGPAVAGPGTLTAGRMRLRMPPRSSLGREGCLVDAPPPQSGRPRLVRPRSRRAPEQALVPHQSIAPSAARPSEYVLAREQEWHRGSEDRGTRPC